MSIGKRVAAGGGSGAVVLFRVRNERSVPVEIRVREQLPECRPSDAVDVAAGGPCRWTRRPGSLRLDGRVPAGGELTAAYRIHLPGAGLGDLRDEPTVEAVRPVTAERNVALPDGGESGAFEEHGDQNGTDSRDGGPDADGGEDPTVEATFTLPEDGSVPTIGASGDDASTDPSGNDDPTDGAGPFDSPFDEPSEEFPELLASAQPIGWGEVTRTMVDELRHGDVPKSVLEELVDLLVAAMDEDAGSSGESTEAAERRLVREAPTHVRVRLDDLEARVGELASYTEALEAFLDEEGTAVDVLDDVAADVEALRTDLGELDERVSSLRDAHRARAAQVEELDEAVERLFGHFDRVADDVGSVQERLARAEDDVEALDDAVAEAVEPTTDGVHERLSTLEDDLAAARSTLDDVASRQERIDTAFGSLLEATEDWSSLGDDEDGEST